MMRRLTSTASHGYQVVTGTIFAPSRYEDCAVVYAGSLKGYPSSLRSPTP